jgi:restriction system protein
MTRSLIGSLADRQAIGWIVGLPGEIIATTTVVERAARVAIPDFQTVMRPLLELAASAPEITLQGAIGALSDHFALTDDERSEMLPSGFQAKFTNRVAWAATHLQKAKALERTGRGRYRLTDRGRRILASTPGPIGTASLAGFPEYQAFKGGGPKAAPRDTAPTTVDTPAEQLENLTLGLRQQVTDEILERLKAGSPSFFEKAVVDLLVAMGHGGSRSDAARAVGRSGDGGIDGVIKEDRLGLDAVYVQAKRWEKVVGRPEVQQFAGSLDGQKASKGVFLTTGSFSAEAHDFVRTIGKRIVLIDGPQLADLMVEHRVGVETAATYHVFRVNHDFFEPPV